MSIDTQASLTIEETMRREARYKSDSFTYPLGVKLANRLLESYRNKEFVADELIATAITKTGLTDFGSSFWRAPMKEILYDLNTYTNFHPAGSFLMEKKIVQNLSNRLWAQYWLKREKEISKPLPPAVLITGLQRTGTTFLQRLLGALPEFRGVVSWEIVNPVPNSKKRTYHGKFLAKFGHAALNYINPDFKAIHSVDANSLEEEVVLMDHCFMSSIFEATFHTPRYSRWLEQQDQIPAYEDLKMWLQFLLWRQPANRFLLLKSPHHMEYLDSFSAVFPDTKIIHTHRHPSETMASYCSMIHLAKKIFQPESNAYEVGRHWLRKNKRLVDNCRDYKRDHQDQFIDVAYKDIVSNPINVVREIYLNLGIQWTDQHEQKALKFCQSHKKNKYGKHVYSLGDYGLNDEIIEATFGTYLDEYQELL